MRNDSIISGSVPISYSMRTPAGKYEAEIRLALVLIVGLLLVLNTSTAYMLYKVKQNLTGELDRRLTTALKLAERYVDGANITVEDQSRQEYIRQQSGLARIQIIPIDNIRGGISGESIRALLSAHDHLPEMDSSSVIQLMNGQHLYRFDRTNQARLGLTVIEPRGERSAVIVAEADARIIGKIEKAAHTALYMASGILVMITILMVVLPRYILRPFRILHDQARSAGRLKQSDSSDEVAEVINSYEQIIDELKSNEAELERLYRESSTKADRLERLNDYILKSIGSGVINIDLAGKIIGFNRAAGEILGLDGGEMIGRHYFAGFPRQTELELIIGAGLERGDVVRTREVEFERSDGDRRWLGVESSIIYDDWDNVVGITLVLADMTELKRLQSELETNRRLAALGEMTGGLAHQLRNSLATISGFCQLLQKKTGNQTSLGEIAESIRGEAETSASMVKRFLNFAGPLSLVTEEIDLGAFLVEHGEKWSAEARSSGVELSLPAADMSLRIIGDVLLLKEALGNVIDNAVQAAGAGGGVYLDLTRADSRAEITISDTGPGIPESMLDGLFTPFVSSKPSGTGLGLALTRKIINLHKGTISLESPPEGGTVCRILLPVREGENAENGILMADTGKNR